MAKEPKLPSAQSVVDYLKSRGQQSSFSARKKMFSTQGLNKRLGNFVGSAKQNMALLDSLRSNENPSFFEGTAPPNAQEAEAGRPSTALRQMSIDNTPEAGGASAALRQMSIDNAPKPPSAFDSPVFGPMFEAIDKTAQSTPNYISSPEQNPGFRFSQENTRNANTVRVPDSMGRLVQNPSQEPSPELRQLSIDNAPAATEVAERFGFATDRNQTANTVRVPDEFGLPNQPASTPTPAAPTFTAPGTIPPEVATRDAETASATGGFSGSTVTPPGTPAQEIDLVNEWLNTAEGKLALEKYQKENLDAEAASDRLYEEAEARYDSEKTTVEQELAANGLAFSGIRGSTIKALADNLAASELNADRQFASKLVDADINFRETVLKGVASLIKDASAEDEKAIAQLNKMGYAVYDGMIVPTLARENASIDDVRADAQLNIALRRLGLAEEANNRAAFNLQRELDREVSEMNDIQLFLAAASSEGAEPMSDDELRVWALENTNLGSTEISAVLGQRNVPQEVATQEAAELVANYAEDIDEESWLLGRTSSQTLVQARQRAVAALLGEDGQPARTNPLTGEPFRSEAHRQLVTDLVLTVDSELINNVEF